MSTQTWLDRHLAACAAPLTPQEKVLVGLMREVDLLVINTTGADVRPHIIKILSGFLGLVATLNTTGRLDRGALDDWARATAGRVVLNAEEEL